ncbi:MAG: glycosyltransferase family 4 protein [Candidatus Aminicenantes bacterium]|nr:glycosyltransferase family 4 protein [Candidatus Aminicenantes bacterium]
MEKKVLFISHLYYPAVGGAERAFRQLAEGLARRGWQVTVLTSDALSTEHFFTHIQTNLKKNEVIEKVEVIRESIHSIVYKFFKIFDQMACRAGRIGVFYRPLTFGPHFFNEFKKLLKKHFPLVISGPTPTSAPFYALLYKFFCPSTKVLILPCLHLKDALHRTWLNLLALRLADYVLPLTEAERKYLLARGVQERKVIRFFLAVEPHIMAAKLQSVQEGKYVLYLGQEGEHKRIPLLLRAMGQLWDQGEEIDLVIVGARTKYSWTIDRLIQNLPDQWKKRIQRFNDVNEEEKIDLIDNCYLMVNPSGYESFGMVFLEAWARRKPVIGAKIPAIKEIIRDGVDGLLFEDGSEKDLARTISFLLKEKGLARQMGLKGYEKVKNYFTQERLMDCLEAHINELILKGRKWT